jgi:PAS domain S-box-containing protein
MVTQDQITNGGDNRQRESSRHFEQAPSEVLAAILDQSVDCIKVIDPEGHVDYMNRNGRCVMEIDDFSTVAGRRWHELWPDEARHLIEQAMDRARNGETDRFEAFCPTAKGTPKWWDVSVSPLRHEGGELRGVVAISRDITDRIAAQELRATASEEMRHRLQNAYMLAGAIISASAKGSSEREAFARELLERLERLGIAQSLLLDPHRFGTTSLPTLVQRLIEPFCTGVCDLSVGDLPDLDLGEEAARVLALTLGELSTNSNKYGALGRGGSIRLDATARDGWLDLFWSERCDAIRPGREHERSGGNGFSLIRRALAANGGALQVEWGEDALAVAITLSTD